MAAVPSSRSGLLAALLASLALTSAACGPPDEASRVRNPGPIQGSFYVSNFFTPSGDMGDGEFAGYLVTTFNTACKERPAGAGGDCYRFDYYVSSQKWAGVYWVYPSNSWGAYPGRDVIGPVDLGNGQRGYNSVSFSAAIDQATLDANPGGLFVNFIAGGIDGSLATPMQPYSDQSCTGDGSTCMPFKAQYGTELTTDWQTLHIDLSNLPLSAVIGAFAWVSSYPPSAVPGMTPPQTIFIDDIAWE
ncbi:MAG TPA: hypothetical protein VGM44_15870 [Polyangiaceae bacterium]